MNSAHSPVGTGTGMQERLSADSPVASPAAAGPSAIAFGGIALVVVALYLGQNIFVPIALAALLAFALTPIVRWLRRRGLPKVVSVLLTVLAAFTVIGGIGFVVASQLIELAMNLPKYQSTLAAKIQSISSADTGEGLLAQVQGNVRRLSSELLGRTNVAEPSEALTVVIEEPTRGALAQLWEWVGPLGHPLATAGIVLVFVVILLIEREDLRDRFIKLFGGGDLRASTAALDEAGQRVSKYLLMQLTVNASYGVVIGAGLFLIGVPNAILWGVLAGVFRFIPMVGQFIAALFPLALAFAVEPGWQMFILVVGLFVALELVYDYLVEPLLYSASTGLSTLAIIVAAIFWTTLWGPIGLILATPLTVCLIVVGRHVPQLRFFDTLLGSDPALTAEEKLYQRLLSGNVEEAVELGERYVESNRLTDFFDAVAVKALRLAEQDRSLGMSEVRVRRLVADGMIEVAREVASHAADQRVGRSKAEGDTPRAVGTPVLCIGARSELDRAAAEMVALQLSGQGINAEVLPPMVVRQHGLAQCDLRGVEAICLCYLEEDPSASIKYIVRRLRRRAPEIKLVACLLNRAVGSDPADLKTDAIANSVGQAASLIDGWVAPHPADPMMPAPLPPNEAERLRALQRLGLTSSRGRYFDEVAEKVSAALDAPIALVTVVDEEHQHWPGAAGLPSALDACRIGDRETSICGHVVAREDVVVVEDVAKDPRFANNPFLLEHGIRFYAGAPLRTLDGFVIGSLCVIDYKPRKFGDEQKKLLSMIANNLMSKVEMSCYGFDLFEGERRDEDRDAPRSDSRRRPPVELRTPAE